MPADWNVWLKLAPGARLPEFQAPVSEVDVWVIESLFIHVTVMPVEIVIGFGAKALAPLLAAPDTMDTAELDGEGVGEGPVGDGDEALPHPATRAVSTAIPRSLLSISFAPSAARCRKREAGTERAISARRYQPTLTAPAYELATPLTRGVTLLGDRVDVMLSGSQLDARSCARDTCPLLGLSQRFDLEGHDLQAEAPPLAEVAWHEPEHAGVVGKV